MKTKLKNGKNSIPGVTEIHLSARDLKKKDQKKLKKQNKAKLKKTERKVFHYLSEAEGSSKLSSKVYEPALSFCLRDVMQQGKVALSNGLPNP
jgi:polyphosphate kinase